MNSNKNAVFEKMYENNFSYVYNFIYMKVLHKETAEEICSDVFFKAYKHVEDYDPDKAGERTWLCTIAKNSVINYFSSSETRKTIPTDTLPEESRDDDYGITRQAVNSEVDRLLQFLNDEEREIISLRFAMEMPVKEIAALTGISQNAMTHRLTRILEKLRKLEEESGNMFSDFF